MNKQYTEEFTLSGKQVIAKVKSLIKEGNARRIIIKNEKGKKVIEVPLTFGAVGGAVAVIFAPALAAIGAVAALLTKCTLVVVKGKK